MAGKCLDYELVKEGEDRTLRFDCEECSFFPSVEESDACMVAAIDALIENPSATRVVFSQKRDYEYDFEQTSMLLEIANVQSELSRQRIFFLDSSNQALFVQMKNIIYRKLKSDPVAAYYELKNMYNSESAKKDHSSIKMASLLSRVVKLMESSKLIEVARRLPYKYGERSIYRSIFKPVIKPDFMFTRLMSAFPLDGEEIDSYDINGTEVSIFKLPGTVQNLYHITPPEFRLSEDKYELLDEARNIISEHKPEKSEFIDPERMRQVFFNVGNDLIDELAEKRGLRLRNKELEELANILVRYTIGFSLVEVLLQDEKVQDITINSPMGRLPAFIVHQDYDECMTNIIPTANEGDSWATKLRLISGRPLDEANPILDTELVLPNARARVAAVTSPLNPSGMAYAFRRHRDKPWTLPLFIKNGMITPAAAGLLSFLIDGARTMLVAGTRSAGKTSFLGALMTEVMRKYRLITIEDTLELPVAALKKLNYNIQSLKVAGALTHGTTEASADEGIRSTLRLGDSGLIVGEVRSSIRGDQEVVVVDGGVTKRIPIKEVEKLDPVNCQVPGLDFDLKTKLLPLTAFVKHEVRERLLEVTTRTGRRVVVTHDHSLFTATRDFRIVPVECKDLTIGSQIVIPTNIPIGYNNVERLDLLKILPELRLKNFEAPLKQAISVLGYREATALCGIGSNDVYKYLRRGEHRKNNIPIASFNKVASTASLTVDSSKLSVTRGAGNEIPAVIEINEDFCAFLGYFVSEGYYFSEQGKGGSVILTNSNNEVLQDMSELNERLFKIKPVKREVRGLGVSYQLRTNSVALVELLKWLNCGRTCTEKRVPPLIFGLSKDKIAAFLRTLYEGDGCITVSKSSGNSIRYNTTSMKLADDVAYLLLAFGIVARIYESQPKKGNPLWVVEFKSREMVESFMDNIGFRFKGKEILKRKWAHSTCNIVHFEKDSISRHLRKHPRRYRHLLRFKRCSKDYLKKVVNDPASETSERIKTFANGEFFLDEIAKIKEIALGEPEPVYDLSVSPSQNFTGGFGGILLHNTEARALYEAMRVGALANVVAGTIHGDSPYGVFDRVVNDLGVPRTSFKATDVIVVANPIKSPDGLHRNRRVIQITEVGKLWQQDPLLEKGFTDLMKYDSKTDRLEATPELMNGDSEVLKSVASNVKEWAGSWDAVWDNVMLRSKVKEAIVSASGKANMPELLEAEFVVVANDQFHRISDEIEDEVGSLDNKRILFEWNEWLKKRLKSSAGQAVYKQA